jgi:AcrR family transcriptional regulator
MATTRTHEKILDAATRLFADEGIHATGVDRVIAEADVAPMTVYRHFAGKDDLVTASLARWSERWLAWLRDETWLGGDDPEARLEALWDALEKWFADEGFRGSYVANVATELRAKPGHPAQAVIAAHRAALRELLQDLLTAPGGPPPAGTVLQLQMLIDGAVAAAAVDRQPGAAAGARAMAAGLLAAHRHPARALAGR